MWYPSPTVIISSPPKQEILFRLSSWLKKIWVPQAAWTKRSSRSLSRRMHTYRTPPLISTHRMERQGEQVHLALMEPHWGSKHLERPKSKQPKSRRVIQLQGMRWGSSRTTPILSSWTSLMFQQAWVASSPNHIEPLKQPSLLPLLRTE